MKIAKIAKELPGKNQSSAKVALLYRGIYSDEALNSLLTNSGIKEYNVEFKDNEHIVVKYVMELVSSNTLPNNGVKNTWKNQLDGNLYYTIQYI